VTRKKVGRPKGSKNPLKQFCVHGHDTFIVGRVKNGMCTECNRELQQEYKEKHQKEIIAYGKERYEAKRDQILEQQHEYIEEHRDEINKKNRDYYKSHREECLKRSKEWVQEHQEHVNEKVRKWRKKHPESVKATKIKSETNRQLRVVAWTDWNKINEFYINKPDGMQGDHYIPLLGDEISGLHVSWNLQYLIPHDNFSKSNSCDLLEVSEWYGKLLEKFRLKDKKKRKK
jgi:hypothetical protein